MTSAGPDITIPPQLLPSDGRFAAGPSKVPAEAVEALAEQAATYLGTSHRHATVRFVIAGLRNGLAELLRLPDGWEILLGVGGTTCFWDMATFGLIERRSQHLSFGEFSSRFAGVVARAPFLDEPEIIESPYGTHPLPEASADVDAYALTHCETSTGVAMELVRPPGTDGATAPVLVDATSAAGGLRVDLDEVDVYYLAPQKCLASDGGLWLAACSAPAIERIESLAAERWVPPFLDLQIALDNSRKDQTYNTPALATVFLAQQQVAWLCESGGLEWAAARCDTSAERVYSWAEASEFATPFVADPAQRSHVVATIDFDAAVDAESLAGVLRRNGVLDTEGYRKLERNQLRIALYPAIDPDDVSALCSSIDYVVAALT